MTTYLINFSTCDWQEEWQICQVDLFLTKNCLLLIRSYWLLRIRGLLLMLTIFIALKCYLILILVGFSLWCSVSILYPIAIMHFWDACPYDFWNSSNSCDCSCFHPIGYSVIISLSTMAHSIVYYYPQLCFMSSRLTPLCIYRSFAIPRY